MLRLFFAIPIPDEIKKELISLFPRQNFHGIRFTKEENLHVTAHFLGSTPDEEVAKIIIRSKEIAENISPFALKIESVKEIAKQRKPEMIWVQFGESQAFENLCLKLREAFPTDEKRKPNPHATLARIKQLKKLPFEIPKVKPLFIKVSELELWKSDLQSTGAEYTKLETFLFR